MQPATLLRVDLARGRKFPNPTWGNASEQEELQHITWPVTKALQGAVTLNTFTFLVSPWLLLV